jgi:hypothetical protein
MDAFLRCHISPGMFSGEVAVRGRAADGTEFSLFVPDDFIEREPTARANAPADGWLYVQVLDREGALQLVRLPGQAFENGQTVTVRDSEIELRPRREAV